MKIRIDKIKITKRIREDIGDIAGLRESIRKHGLFNPILLTKNYELLAGFRRLEAVKSLGWSEVECSIVESTNKLEKLDIEVDENMLRKDFTPAEIEKSIKRRRELASKGLRKLWLWLKMFWQWLKSLFIKKK